MVVTNRQQQILEFINRFQAKNGFGPTIREVCQAMGLASPGSLIKHLRVLEREGELTRSPGKKRTWQVTRNQSSAPSIPLIGQIAAGTPILAEENRETDLPVDPALFGCDITFALRVKGESMIGVHIQDGDLAVIKPQAGAVDGQVVAVLVDGVEPEATLKIFRGGQGRIELQAANSAYPPLIFEGEECARVKVLGRLVGVISSR